MKTEARAYIFGFLISLTLTLAAYFVVEKGLLVGQTAILVILGLALIQVLVQLIFFLHLDQEAGPRMNLGVFLTTTALILILVIGSLVIMKNLNYHMTSEQINDYLKDQGAF